ncbi:MAG: hypothetical protein KAH54_10970 [Candidatus Sabulitectum sp.]|nr:hypothetical protein [Candidatus Sabulitectum sp.]
MRSDSKFLIAAIALSSLFFVFPSLEHRTADSTESLVLLLLASVGILLSRIFVLSSEGSDKTGIEPAVIVCLAAWNSSSLIYPVTALLAFSGSVLNSIRVEKDLSKEIPEAIFQGVSFAFLLKLSFFFYWSFQIHPGTHGAIQIYLALAAVVIPVTVLRCLSVCFFSGRKGNFREILKKNILLNTFILLLAVPGALVVLRGEDTPEVLITCALGLFSMLVVHGINLRQNRSKHEKTDELETVLKLNELSGDLFSATSEMDALRTLNKAVSSAWDCNTAVQWKTLTLFGEEKWDTAGAVNIEHPAGLRIWIDSFSSTIPLYIESFLNRAVPVLTSLEAEKRMRKTSWESMETMISFVEQNNSEFAGFSRRVASTAVALCSALDMDNWFEDCMRLAGLLHMISLQKQSEENTQENPHSLPEITRLALQDMTEHWSGTGPRGISQDEIPLPARILAVSIAWERAMNSGITMAVREMNMRTGTIYDPRLAELIVQLNN